MFSRRTLLGAAAAFAGLPAAARLALADPRNFASSWSEASHSAVRLIAGRTRDGLTAGIEMRLAQGFKTYWRDPGESGVPPTFDWAGSENLARAEVLWPVPHRFEDAGAFSIGYKAPLILPVRATATDADKPVLLRLKIDYAVCSSMCIPAQGAAALALKSGGKSDGPHAARIAEALARVPARAAAFGPPTTGPSIAAISLIDGAKPALAIDAWAPRDTGSLDLFVEGPKGSFFAKPTIEYPKEPPRGIFTRVRFVSVIEERAKKLARWPLTLTLAVDGEGVEYGAEIEAPTAR